MAETTKAPVMVDEKHLAFLQNPSDKDNTSTGSVTFLPALTPKEDRILTTKVDFRILPILGLLYLICFLDRTNIANAKLAGLVTGLNMPSNGYNTALWIFYIPFVLFEVPSNMIMAMSWNRPNLWLGGLTFVLGILAMCQGLAHTYHGLLGVRFLMGICETALPAGAGLLIASYYRKKELGLRFAMFFAFGDLGACFSGLLAYAIQGMDGTAGYAGWRWIFIIEGLVTIFFSIFVFIFVPNFPANDTWLNETDKANLVARLEADRGLEKKELHNVSWTKTVFDYRIWLMTLLFFCADMSAGSISSFNPTILSQLGWTSRRAQVMTIPVWIVGVIGSLIAGLGSGHWNKRWPFIQGATCLSMIGWIIHYCQVQPASVRYFAQFLIAFGTFITMPLYIGLLTANLRGRASKSFGTAVQLGIGNCANFVSSNVFITTQAPRYPVGFGTGLGITAFGLPVMFSVMFLFSRHNKRIDEKIAALAPGEELDDQVDYKYVY